MSSPESNNASLPDIPEDTSRGSSVSSDFQKEYEDILKFAIVTPKFEIAPDVYEHGSKINQPQQVTMGRTSTSHPFSNQQPVNLSTIIENSSDDSNSSVIQTDSSSLKIDRSRSEDSIETPQPVDISRREVDDGRKAFGKLHEDSFKKTPMNVFQSPMLDTSSTSATQSPSSLSVDDFDKPMDEDLIRMEGLMDEWCLDLKRNVLGEFSQAKLKLIEKLKLKIHTQKQVHAAELDTLHNQIEGLKELLHTFEKSVHQKDVVITNLTDAVQKQKEKGEKLKILLTWKLKHNDEKRETFASKLAQKHYKRSLATKAWAGWRSVVETRWKQRVERACQARSQEVCIKLTEDYEERLQGLQKSLETARSEIARMHNERDQYEETMKKAFMRGVCALNMEAMHMFKEGGNEENCDPRNPEPPAPQTSSSDQSTRPPQTHQQPQPSYPARGDIMLAPSEAPRKSTVSTSKPSTERRLHIKAVGKGDFAGKRLHHTAASSKPNVTSVFVERHPQDQKSHPPTAKAASYTRNQALKNQTGNRISSSTAGNQRTNRLQTVKVVE